MQSLESPLAASNSTASQRLNVLGSVQGNVRLLTISETENLRFVSHEKILTWEGIVEHVGQANAAVHLIDTEIFIGHYDYAQKGLGRGSAYRQTNFFRPSRSQETPQPASINRSSMYSEFA